MLLNVKELSQFESKKLMDVYEESNIKNIKHFFPECRNQEEGKKKVEEGFLDYIQNEFFKLENSSYYLWEENNISMSAMRFYKIGEGLYFLEALETHPSYRKNGYAQKLICSVIEELKKNGDFVLKSYVYPENIASLKTHKRCGFIEDNDMAFDYTDNEYVENVINLIFRYKA